ncbi:peptidylprolyl isomerase [Spirochaeta isovalerica]|uniref:Parvulin-like peptidyl-prolyl isomerase n=1 Tax=Spirochaeta isovalerica TaxID=150 RepID=A0A841R3Z9_9SPIO|nr:peptidylprolyl isomerase [Spirochaeta isovalerica]MBB6478546.1 parvulin-like peptidyl-prolyl isomerase [Spirochaeta isovalerica]
MKKTIFITALLCLTSTIFGQSLLDKPAAVIKLIETEPISSKLVNQNIKILETNARREFTLEEKTAVLDSMIDSALVVQAAKRDGITISDAQVKQYGIAQISQAAGRPLSEAEFTQYIEQKTRQPISAYLGELKKQLLIQNYISEKGKNDFLNIAQPSEREITAAYTKEETSFINPEMVRVSHVFFSFIADPFTSPRMMNATEKEAVQKKADDIMKKLKNGTMTFEQAVRLHSEDQDSKVKAGDIGFLVRNDQNALQNLGASFIDEVYNMSVGQIELIQSVAGYHIVRVTDRIDKKFLKLDDPVNPAEQMTVREYIGQQLYLQKRQEMFQVVSKREVERIRNEAEVTLYKQNLGWE